MQLDLDSLQRGIASVQSNVAGLDEEVVSIEKDLVQSRPDSKTTSEIAFYCSFFDFSLATLTNPN